MRRTQNENPGRAKDFPQHENKTRPRKSDYNFIPVSIYRKLFEKFGTIHVRNREQKNINN